MNQSVWNLGLTSRVFGPAPDVELAITVEATRLSARVAEHAASDEQAVAAWRAVCDGLGAAHGGTPWEYQTTPHPDRPGAVITATHSFDGVPVFIWTEVGDTDGVRHLLQEG